MKSILSAALSVLLFLAIGVYPVCADSFVVIYNNTGPGDRNR